MRCGSGKCRSSASALGHQMLADALGGRVERMAEAEVGILEVELTEAGRADPLLAGLDRTVTCFNGTAAR